MMKIFTVNQIRAWDAYTIEHEPISSVDLMNRAAQAFTDWFAGIYTDTGRPVYIIAGTGNNGGDGVAAARLLHFRFYTVKIIVCDFSGKHSADFDAQIRDLPPRGAVAVHWLKDSAGLPEIPENALIIDALFGSGLTRPLAGHWAGVMEWLNGLPNDIAAVDLPSGLFADRHSDDPCIRASRTFSFETPKLAFFFPENAERVGEWAFGNIGLHPAYALKTETPFHYMTGPEIRTLVKPRPRFSHKGTYGHALLVNGGHGKMGAAVLSARACLRAGVGLLTAHTPGCGYEIIQISVPEAMCSADKHPEMITQAPDPKQFTAVGVGCGIGAAPETAAALKQLLRKTERPVVLDADALNLLSKNKYWWKLIPEDSVLTPHPKEFERLFGASENDFERLERQMDKARAHRVFIVLKGAFSSVATPEGECYFNSTGNPGMAAGGSGDVLTGILTALLAQGYEPRAACLLGVYLHGLAGDLAAAELSQPGMTAGDLIDYLPKAWKKLSDQ